MKFGALQQLCKMNLTASKAETPWEIRQAMHTEGNSFCKFTVSPCNRVASKDMHTKYRIFKQCMYPRSQAPTRGFGFLSSIKAGTLSDKNKRRTAI
ncbi:hypothetical protein QYF36_009483 [Acer negundo]|nr:hypothetical protein QYF36_009483 [Acer negundo]